MGKTDHKEEIVLPKSLDVLIHLPMSDEKKDICVAHALQYNISALGKSTSEALEKLVDLVTVHVREAIEQGFSPIRIAEQYYWKAFAVGTPVHEFSFADVNPRLSVELAKYLDYPHIWIRSICAMQKKTGIFNIRELVAY